MKKQKTLCAALAAVLVLCCYPGENVKAVEKKQTQTAEKTEEKAQPEETKTELSSEETTEEELKEYYGDSVFIGDSIMLGFRNYSAKKENFVHDIQFLAAGSYSAGNALKPVVGKNVHPMYKGKKYQVWDAIPMIGSKRAFILLGMNDISIFGLEGARDTYKEVIDKIVEASPDIEIHIISVTYTLKGKGKAKLNNDNIAEYNVLLQEMAEENGWKYIDLCTPVSDGAGNLAEDCCSDGFVHLSKSAYAKWEEELIRYAEEQPAEDEPDAEEKTEKGGAAKEKTEKEETGQKTPAKK